MNNAIEKNKLRDTVVEQLDEQIDNIRKIRSSIKTYKFEKALVNGKYPFFPGDYLSSKLKEESRNFDVIADDIEEACKKLNQ